MSNSLQGIAVIGMEGRFPGAKTVAEFWQNLRDGRESISFFEDEALIAAGIDPSLLHYPNYVKAGAVLEDIDRFDAAFFELSPREAAVTDPQHRLFLECAWNALEQAGYGSNTYDGSIGIYAGGNLSTYLVENLIANREFIEDSVGWQALGIGNDKDYIPTRVSYKLNLKGPSINVSTACSTSLVAVHQACQGLLGYQCDMALAGGVSIQLPHIAGYLYQKEGIASPDGHCRTFDAKAQGTVFGSGVGIVVLKRLEDALADGDRIYATIQGSAVNNDGSEKVGFTAPSVDGQARVIAEAQDFAGFDPETISYIEAHGTGTALGDPIEIRALQKVFNTQKRGFCAIGSVKTNVGHLNSAAGIAGLIKTVMALHQKQLPPSLHFEQPNPEIDFANSPFYVNTQLSDWQRNSTPRRAGVSSFGFGGTNAHVVLEEAPPLPASSPSRPWQLLLLSAKTASALETATTNLVARLQQQLDLNLADVAYTLQVGRRAFSHRRMLVCQNREEAIAALSTLDPQQLHTAPSTEGDRSIVFLFPGQGAQYIQMGRDLYEHEPVFREWVDRGSEFLIPYLRLDLRQILYPHPDSAEAASQTLQQTAIAQPALFVIEYALAQLWQSWGVCPTAMVGHSIGEYVAATIAGVFTWEAALSLVAARGQLMQSLPTGAMIAVSLTEAELQPYLNEFVALAAVNAPSSCVLSGTTEEIASLQETLNARGIDCRRLHMSHAFHSPMMESILATFTNRVQQAAPKPPQIPFISNVTGTWIAPKQATNPHYWATHLRQTVRFAEGLQVLFQDSTSVFLEVGPGRTLSKLARSHPKKLSSQPVFHSIRHPQEHQPDLAVLLQTLGQLWLAGVSIRWTRFYQQERRQRVPLPTYPFERKRYWIDPPASTVKTLPITSQDRWQAIVTAGQHQAEAGIPTFDRTAYLENKVWLDRLCVAYINRALTQLGAFHQPDACTIEAILEQCRILPRYRQLLRRWLQVLVERGQLQQHVDRYSQFLPVSDAVIASSIETAQVRWADTPQVMELIQSCGDRLAAVLTGAKQPLELFDALIYNQANDTNPTFPWANYYNAIIRISLASIVKHLPADVRLRVLEVGAGMGITTAELLPILPPQRTTYTFTDISSGFLTQARQTFCDYDFVNYRLLDLEISPQAQGYEPHSFDIVIAANVLHATRDLDRTLQHVRSLLAPEGILMLWEMTQPQLDFDITWGLLVKELEDERGDRGTPFLLQTEWRDILMSRGFTTVAAYPQTDTLGQHAIVAQAGTVSTVPSQVPSQKAFTERVGDRQTPIVQTTSSKKSDLADWFYLPSWKRGMLPSQASSHAVAGCWLIWLDECGLGTELAKQLQQQGAEIVLVKAGEQFRQDEHHCYTLNPNQPQEYDLLLQALRSQGLAPSHIVHLWSVTTSDRPSTEFELDTIQAKGFYSLLFLAQAIGRQHFSYDLQIVAISNQIQAVTGEESLCPEKATLLGAMKVIPQEYANLHCRSIDVVLTDRSPTSAFVARLVAELTTTTADDLIAYRGRYRWAQTYEPIRLNADRVPQLRQGGVYLITGGLGAIGLTLAEYLAKTVRAKLILTGRSVPARENWSSWLATHDQHERTSRKLRQFLALEASGAEVMAIQADVSDLEQMKVAIAQAQSRFGAIDGVIHAAGVLGDSAIQRKTIEQVEQVFAPKIKGTQVLEALFKDTPLDFFILCSSGATVRPLFGQVAYAAANAFLDAFAHFKTATTSRFTTSIGWYGWQNEGMGIEGTKRITERLAPAAPQIRSVDRSPIQQALVEADRVIYLSRLSPQQHWILAEHRLMGQPTLPGTAYLELVHAAYTQHTGNFCCELKDVAFLSPLVVSERDAIDLRIEFKPVNDRFEFVVMSAVPDRGEQWQAHAKGQIAALTEFAVRSRDLSAIASRCNESRLMDFTPEIVSEFLALGSRWHNIKCLQFGTDEGFGQFELPEAFSSDLDTYRLHPALLDSAISFFSSVYGDRFLPFAYKRLRCYASLPAKIYSHIIAAESNREATGILRFQITLFDEYGKVLVEIEDYTLRRIEDTLPSPSSSPKPENSYLSIATPGQLNTLTYYPMQRQAPRAGEVEIATSATGLNFQEVLIALGLLTPSDAAFKFGYECAGTIAQVGEGVTQFAVGDEVIAFGSSCFSPFITTKAALVAPKPPSLSFEQAATIPIAFSTAYLALIHYGRLCSGETVLIHAAAGGVGMAAVQIAQSVGAKIVATAGTPEKRDYLRSLGIEHVFDSRSLDFAEAVMHCTNGRGVDVVLNSLSGEFIERSLSVLARYGRFLELGLRDILNDHPLGLHPFRNNLSFIAVHLDRDLPNFHSLWQAVIQQVNDEKFRPLPHRVFGVTEIADAFAYMAQAKHIGKIVVSLQDQATVIAQIKANFQSAELAVPEIGTAWGVAAALTSTMGDHAAQPTRSIAPNFQDWLSPSEGIEVFRRVLSSGLPQVLVFPRETIGLNFDSSQSPFSLRPRLEPESTALSEFPAPATTHSGPDLNNAYVAPENEIEQAIANVWQAVLGIQEIGIHDNFFDLGGDSLLAVQVRSKLQHQLDRDLSVADTFEYPTIHALATYLKGQSTDTSDLQQLNERADQLQVAIKADEALMEQRRRARE